MAHAVSQRQRKGPFINASKALEGEGSEPGLSSMATSLNSYTLEYAISSVHT